MGFHFQMIYATSLLACLLGPAPALNGATGGPTFEAPVPLTANGTIIDVGKDIGHAGPHLRDHDGDGKTDLLVSSFRGTIEVFRNVGTHRAPAYETQGKIQAVGFIDGMEKTIDLTFHNW